MSRACGKFFSLIMACAMLSVVWYVDGLRKITDQTLGLPLLAFRVEHPSTPYLALIVSGDGGWAKLDRHVSETFVSEGISVVVLNSLRYFWNIKTPEQLGADLTYILNYYSTVWGKDRLILIGYSRGAGTLPFMVSRLPEALRAKIVLMVLLGPATTTDFEIKLKDFWSNPRSDYAVLPELRKSRVLKTLCIYGTEETDTLCRGLEPSLAKSLALPGRHHFGGKYHQIAGMILRELE